MGVNREDVTAAQLREAQRKLIDLSSKCGELAQMLEQNAMPSAYLHWRTVKTTYDGILLRYIDKALIDLRDQLRAFLTGKRDGSIEQLRSMQNWYYNNTPQAPGSFRKPAGNPIFTARWKPHAFSVFCVWKLDRGTVWGTPRESRSQHLGSRIPADTLWRSRTESW